MVSAVSLVNRGASKPRATLTLPNLSPFENGWYGMSLNWSGSSHGPQPSGLCWIAGAWKCATTSSFGTGSSNTTTSTSVMPMPGWICHASTSIDVKPLGTIDSRQSTAGNPARAILPDRAVPPTSYKKLSKLRFQLRIKFRLI